MEEGSRQIKERRGERKGKHADLELIEIKYKIKYSRWRGIGRERSYIYWGYRGRSRVVR